jgi:hypothetical protein
MRKWNRYPGVIAIIELLFVMTIQTLCRAIFLLSEMSERELTRAATAVSS